MGNFLWLGFASSTSVVSPCSWFFLRLPSGLNVLNPYAHLLASQVSVDSVPTLRNVASLNNGVLSRRTVARTLSPSPNRRPIFCHRHGSSCVSSGVVNVLNARTAPLDPFPWPPLRLDIACRRCHVRVSNPSAPVLETCVAKINACRLIKFLRRIKRVNFRTLSSARRVRMISERREGWGLLLGI